MEVSDVAKTLDYRRVLEIVGQVSGGINPGGVEETVYKRAVGFVGRERKRMAEVMAAGEGKVYRALNQ